MKSTAIEGVKVLNVKRTNLIIKFRMVRHSIYLVFNGALKPGRFFSYLRRLLIFLSKMKGNKYIKVSNGTKINLYVPAFPTKAFFHATHKMLEFEKKMPAITALVSITSACRYDCEHCYQKRDKGKDVNINQLKDAVRYFQDNGVAFFNLEGGEPFLVYPRLKALCETIDDRSEILINSTGDGITLERLIELKESCNLLGVMFSLHTDDPERLNQFMKSDQAWSNLVNGIGYCHKAGVSVMFNACLPRDAFYNGGFDKVMRRAKELGGSLIQLIKPKSAGGWLLEGADHFSPEDLEYIKHRVIEYNTLHAYKSYPFIAAMIIDEDADHFGCTAGGTDRFYLNAKGDIQACEFLNISFGNITEEPVENIYSRMRESFEKPGCNWLCEAYHAKIVDQFQHLGQPVLPLAPEVTRKIMNTVDHGEEPDFYKRAK